jgi:uncharacterized protein YlxW (UPF0749 family)
MITTLIAFFFKNPLGRYVGGFLALLAVCAGIALAFDRWLASHDAGVKAAQLALFQKTAAEAKAGEVQRQADAVNAAVGAYQRRLSESQAAETKAKTDLERGISDYEKHLADLKRQCLADDADVDFILRHH